MSSRLVYALVLASLLGCSKTPPRDAPHDGHAQLDPESAAPKPAAGDAAPGGPITCGKNTCKPGEYCCNASCGICAPEGGFCTQQVCDEGAAPPGAPTGSAGAACSADADCRLHASYCNEAPCVCLALAAEAPAPTCAGPSSVRCLVDPCQTKVARCAGGTCAAEGK